uniref:hypothetical protein n=1 Tax=Bacillus sp. BML-BC060 TaxID=2842487 RepID=UPI001C7E5AAC
EQVVKEMIYRLGNMCDLACANANHVFSLGQNNKHKKKYIRKYNDNIHNINEFRWLLHERDERRKNESVSTNIIDFTREGVRRDPAITALFNGEVSWRNHACFTLSLVMRFLGYSEEETENYILSVWLPIVKDKGEHPFTTSEAIKCIQHGYSGKYRNFHSNWVEVVTGIECNLKGYFRGYSPYINQGIYDMDTKQRIIQFFKENNGQWVGTKKELAEEIQASFKTLEKVIARMKENEELQFETKRGRNSKTTFTLVEQTQETPTIGLEEFKTHQQQFDDLNELEEIINQMSAN